MCFHLFTVFSSHTANESSATSTCSGNTSETQIKYTQTLTCVTRVSEAAENDVLHAELLPSPDICACRAWCGLGCCPSSMSLSEPSSSGMSTSESSSLATEENSWDLWQMCSNVCVWECVTNLHSSWVSSPPLLICFVSFSLPSLLPGRKRQKD